MVQADYPAETPADSFDSNLQVCYEILLYLSSRLARLKPGESLERARTIRVEREGTEDWDDDGGGRPICRNERGHKHMSIVHPMLHSDYLYDDWFWHSDGDHLGALEIIANRTNARAERGQKKESTATSRALSQTVAGSMGATLEVSDARERPFAYYGVTIAPGMSLLAVEPEHPGIAHYVIHSFDYPELADAVLVALTERRTRADIDRLRVRLLLQHVPRHDEPRHLDVGFSERYPIRSGAACRQKRQTSGPRESARSKSGLQEITSGAVSHSLSSNEPNLITIHL